MNSSTNAKRGGQRPGAGRPPTNAPRKTRHTVTLDETTLTELTAISENLSDAIRTLVRRHTMFSYVEAIRYLCGDPALQSDDDRRDEARDVITPAVWPLVTEDGDGRGELRDWVAEGDWSPADLGRLEAFSADALAAEWDAMQREARRALAE